MSLFQFRAKSNPKSNDKAKVWKVWWYDFQFQGQRYRASTKTRNRALAERIERDMRRELEEGCNGIKPISQRKRIDELVKEYVERKSLTWAPRSLEIANDAFKKVLPHFGRKFPSEVSAKDLRDYQKLRLSVGTAPTSVNRETTLFASVLRRAKVWFNISPDFKQLRLAAQYGAALTPSEETELLEKCDESSSLCLYPVVTLALCTAMRNSEIRLLRWWQVDLTNALLVVGQSKTLQGTGRRVMLNCRAMRALNKWAERFPERKSSDFVFPAERYGMKNHLMTEMMVYNTDPTKPMGSWKKAWRVACTKAKLKIRFHDLRHTAVTRMLESQVPFNTVARICGWSPANMVLMISKYGHLFDKSMKAALSKLEGENPEIAVVQADSNQKDAVLQDGANSTAEKSNTGETAATSVDAIHSPTADDPNSEAN